MQNKIFEQAQIGPLTLRNRTIRSAAFESMCPGHEPSQQLFDYHTSVARGGVGMTTIAYAAVTEGGLSFDRQLVMRPEIVPGLRRLTDAIHEAGAAAGIQLGHCGNMSHKDICGCIPVGACTGFNLYSPTLVRGLRREELPELSHYDYVVYNEDGGVDRCADDIRAIVRAEQCSTLRHPTAAKDYFA
jgi:2,4-dienoyl-CoA reductase-like NADH-dependent reductase (Old Yellow Enzyme family)